jgi:hypothetical protein
MMNEDGRGGCFPEILEAFPFEGRFVSAKRVGGGHINDTFLCVFDEHAYTVQRINHHIFTRPDELMDNIRRITEFIAEKIRAAGGDPVRETLHLVKTKAGGLFFKDKTGSYWRVYDFIDHARAYDKVEKPEHLYESGLAFGRFQNRLAGFDAASLHVAIPDFHNTPKRFQVFMRAIKNDVKDRVKEVKPEISFFLEREEVMAACTRMLDAGALPLRVTHNDAKLSNVLIDDETDKAICIIDLDTVMKGSAIYDFGDAIRFGANTAPEDETDLSKVSLSLDLYKTYTEGFLEGCGGSLTADETAALPLGAKVMTLEQGMRFLTDYLEGDSYYAIRREKHNLDRARAQISLAADMEKKWEIIAHL